MTIEMVYNGQWPSTDPFSPHNSRYRRMNRRLFLTTAGAAGAAPIAAQNYSDYSKDPRPDVPQGALTAGSLDGPIFAGTPVVSGPASEAITILQPLQRHATGHLEFAVEDGPWTRVDAGQSGLMPLAEHVLKISGHTHDYLWMPKKEGQPIAQLIGGAPQPKFATLIQGTATKDELKLKMTKLDGTVVTDVTLGRAVNQ